MSKEAVTLKSPRLLIVIIIVAPRDAMCIGPHHALLVAVISLHRFPCSSCRDVHHRLNKQAQPWPASCTPHSHLGIDLRCLTASDSGPLSQAATALTILEGLQTRPDS
ncbi:unnamed protein product [Periconia digitata]|uniref:Uncharacterized protein n=1 Tax=Periconia digitata TaxID=1303443 RepID=A0A9W4USY9_9PLEO|nr:unnamed protein product [Periconia digitata]